LHPPPGELQQGRAPQRLVIPGTILARGPMPAMGVAQGPHPGGAVSFVRLCTLLLGALLVVACSGASPQTGSPRQSDGAEVQAPERAATPKILRIAIQRAPLGFVPHLNGASTTSGGGLQMTEIAHNYLVLTDAQSAYQPGVALELPSLEKGTWTLGA